MRKYLIIILALLFYLPVNAQYLLDEISTKLVEDEVNESYDYDIESSSKVGYRGFFDLGMGFGSDFNILISSTTHGYQVIEDLLFIGVGFGTWYNTGGSSIPIFADVRSEFLNFGNWKLFGDLKTGYAVLDRSGIFIEPQIGVRYPLTDKLGLNFGVSFKYFNCENGDNNYYYYYGDESGGLTHFNIKIGIDF